MCLVPGMSDFAAASWEAGPPSRPSLGRQFESLGTGVHLLQRPRGCDALF